MNIKEITVQANPESLIVLDKNYSQIVYSNEKPVSSGIDEGLKELFKFNWLQQISNIVNIL